MSKKRDKTGAGERFRLLDFDETLEALPEPEDSSDDDDDDERDRRDAEEDELQDVFTEYSDVRETMLSPSGDAFPELDNVFDRLNDDLKNTSKRIPRQMPVDPNIKRPQATTKTWADRYGRQIPIEQMDDDYLINTMRMLVKRAPGQTLREKVMVLEHTERCWERMVEVANERKLMDEVTWGFR